jgi:hypothetical protein
MDNSSSEDRLDYENGPVVAIAVGGNTLSRGLTLEGLSVSYFVRAVSAYDTLNRPAFSGGSISCKDSSHGTSLLLPA